MVRTWSFEDRDWDSLEEEPAREDVDPLPRHREHVEESGLERGDAAVLGDYLRQANFDPQNVDYQGIDFRVEEDEIVGVTVPVRTGDGVETYTVPGTVVAEMPSGSEEAVKWYHTEREAVGDRTESSLTREEALAHVGAHDRLDRRVDENSVKPDVALERVRTLQKNKKWSYPP